MSLTSLKTILPASLTESGGKLGLMLLRHLHSCLWSSQASFYFFFKKEKEKKHVIFQNLYPVLCTSIYAHTNLYRHSNKHGQPGLWPDQGHRTRTASGPVGLGQEPPLSSHGQEGGSPSSGTDTHWISSCYHRQHLMLTAKKTAAHMTYQNSLRLQLSLNCGEAQAGLSIQNTLIKPLLPLT